MKYFKSHEMGIRISPREEWTQAEINEFVESVVSGMASFIDPMLHLDLIQPKSPESSLAKLIGSLLRGGVVSLEIFPQIDQPPIDQPPFLIHYRGGKVVDHHVTWDKQDTEEMSHQIGIEFVLVEPKFGAVSPVLVKEPEFIRPKKKRGAEAPLPESPA